MNSIWRVFNLADLESHGLMTSQMATVILNVSLLTVVSKFGHSEVPSRNLFGIVCSSLLFSEVHIVLDCKLHCTSCQVRSREFASCALHLFHLLC